MTLLNKKKQYILRWILLDLKNLLIFIPHVSNESNLTEKKKQLLSAIIMIPWKMLLFFNDSVPNTIYTKLREKKRLNRVIALLWLIFNKNCIYLENTSINEQFFKKKMKPIRDNQAKTHSSQSNSYHWAYGCN